jgi:hypothetical protein
MQVLRVLQRVVCRHHFQEVCRHHCHNKEAGTKMALKTTPRPTATKRIQKVVVAAAEEEVVVAVVNLSVSGLQMASQRLAR